MQAAFPPNAFPAENIAQNPRQKKDKSAPSRKACAGELLYPLFISADAGKALAVPSRHTAVSRAIRRGRGCLPVRTMPLWRSGRGRKRTSGKPRADLPQRRAGRPRRPHRPGTIIRHPERRRLSTPFRQACRKGCTARTASLPGRGRRPSAYGEKRGKKQGRLLQRPTPGATSETIWRVGGRHAPMAKSIYSYSEESSSVISEENNNIEKSRFLPDGKGKDAGNPEC